MRLDVGLEIMLNSLIPKRLKTILRKNKTIRNLYYSVKPLLIGSSYDFFTIQDLAAWTLDWIKSFPEHYDVIIGIPRSGLIVASIIACKLGKPLSTPEKFLKGEYWLPTKDRTIEVSRIEKVLLVDDAAGDERGTLYRCYRQLKQRFPELQITKGVLIVGTKNAERIVDLHYKKLTKGAFFEWNLAHCTYKDRRLGVDMDGVLCDEPPPEVDMDEQRYVAWIKNARPNIIPTYTIEAIVTNRLEKYRQITEEWLRRNKVKYKNLEMLDLPDKSLRTPENMLKQKIDAIKKFQLSWFWESSLSQAEAIWKACKIPVLCTDKMVLLS
jgi:hypoxanthine phosphoribosyltransferase